jgi:hypothetical protein
MDQVIILLMDGSYPVCFYKMHTREFCDPDAKWHWIEMKPDPTVGYVDNPHNAGIISFKMSVSKMNAPINPKEHAAWKSRPPMRAKAVRIRTYIY